MADVSAKAVTRRVAVAGCSTDVGVQTTARGAHDLDYECTVIGDCCLAPRDDERRQAAEVRGLRHPHRGHPQPGQGPGVPGEVALQAQHPHARRHPVAHQPRFASCSSGGTDSAATPFIARGSPSEIRASSSGSS